MLQVQFEQFGDTVLLHGDTIQHVGGLHGAPAVGDDDELRLIAHPAQVLGKPAHVGVIQRGLDLVQNADCLLYTSPSPRDISGSRMPSSA